MDLCEREIFVRSVPNLLSPAMMAPEWVLGDNTVSEASQVFCIGALMYEMLTGTLPFTADSAPATIERVLHEMPESPRKSNPSVGHEADRICMKCLAKEPQARYAAIQDLLGQLQPFESQ
jgi:serine/threonine-protein kinase